MDIKVHPESIHGDQPQISSKIPRILGINQTMSPTQTQNARTSRERQPIPKPSHRRLEIARLEITIQTLTLHRRIHIRSNQRNRAPRDPHVGLKSDLFSLKIQANIPRDFRNCETAWRAEKLAERCLKA